MSIECLFSTIEHISVACMCAAEVTGVGCHSRRIKEKEQLEAEEKARREAENAEEVTTEEWTVASFFGF